MLATMQASLWEIKFITKGGSPPCHGSRNETRTSQVHTAQECQEVGLPFVQMALQTENNDCQIQKMHVIADTDTDKNDLELIALSRCRESFFFVV